MGISGFVARFSCAWLGEGKNVGVFKIDPIGEWRGGDDGVEEGWFC